MLAAEEYGHVVDVPFPAVEPNMSEEEIKALADNCIASILSYNPEAVMCQGEFTLCHAVVDRLKEKDIPVVAACSQRNAIDLPDGRKASQFEFIRFRRY